VVTFFSLIAVCRLGVPRGGANPEVSASGLILLQLFAVGGMVFFVIGLGIASPILNKYVTPAKMRFPLGELCDFDIDSDGQFYCAVSSSGRVQVYFPKGNFVRGWFVKNL